METTLKYYSNLDFVSNKSPIIKMIVPDDEHLMLIHLNGEAEQIEILNKKIKKLDLSKNKYEIAYVAYYDKILLLSNFDDEIVVYNYKTDSLVFVGILKLKFPIVEIKNIGNGIFLLLHVYGKMHILFVNQNGLNPLYYKETNCLIK